MKKKQVRKTTKNSPAKSPKDGKSIIKTGVNPNVKNGEKSADDGVANSSDPDAHMIQQVLRGIVSLSMPNTILMMTMQKRMNISLVVSNPKVFRQSLMIIRL